METYFYLTVRVIVAGYILYKVWDVLFRKKLFGLWDRIPVREKKPKKETPPPKKVPAPYGKVVGRTHKVILDDPRKAALEPVGSVDLEPTGFIGQDEPDIPDDEQTQRPYIPSEDELYGEDSFPDYDDTDLSSGVTFEELSEAAEVLQDGTDDDDKKTRAAKTVYNVRDTEIFDFLATEVSNKMSVESLMRDCLDEDGMPQRKKRPQKAFDINRFV